MTNRFDAPDLDLTTDPVAVSDDGITQLRNLAVRQLFSITIDLAGAIQVNGDRKLDRRLRNLVDKTDRMITELRRAAASASAVDPAVPSDDPPERRLVIGLLRQAGFTVDWLLNVGRNDSQPDAVDLEEASQAVHRALIALSPATEPGRAAGLSGSAV